MTVLTEKKLRVRIICLVRRTLDSLDLRRCVIGSDLVALIDGQVVTIYRRCGPQEVEHVGIYRGAAAAWAALDVDDAPG